MSEHTLVKRYEVQFLNDCKHHSDTDDLAQGEILCTIAIKLESRSTSVRPGYAENHFQSPCVC
jgi:hypothetical protein